LTVKKEKTLKKSCSKTKKSELTNKDKFETTTSSISKRSCDKKNVGNKTKSTENSTLTPSANFSLSQPEQVVVSHTKDRLGVTALVAIMEPATESQASRVSKQPLRSRPSNKIKVLLDSGLDRDLIFLPKGKDKPFPYLTRQVPKSWHTSNGSFQTTGQGKIRVKFFDYSNSKEYFLQPDVVEYKENSLTKPGFDLILGSNTLKELGIVLDFWTKEITLDDISLPMRDINNLKTRATVERAWTMNNSIYQETSKNSRVRSRQRSASYTY